MAILAISRRTGGWLRGLGSCVLLLGCAGCEPRRADPFADERAFRDDHRAAHAAYAEGDYRRAEQLFVRLLERYGHSVDAHLFSDQAQETWRRGYHDLGWVRVALGKYEPAIGNFRSAAYYVDAHTVFFPQTFGFVSQLAGRHEEAERWYRKSLADPATLNNRIARLSLALLYCDSGRAADQRAEELQLETCDDDFAHPPKELYPAGDASYWNIDQVRQEAHYRERLGVASARGEQDCLPLIFRTLVALEGAAYDLRVSRRHEERLRTMGQTIEVGQRLFGRDHPMVAEAIHQQACALRDAAYRFAYATGPERHRIVANDSLLMREQSVALEQRGPDEGERASLRWAEERRQRRLAEAAVLLEQARTILERNPGGYVGLRTRIGQDLEAIRRDRAGL